jgi:hypothetical protein
MGNCACGLERSEEKEVRIVREGDITSLVTLEIFEYLELDNRRGINRSSIGRCYFRSAHTQTDESG